MKDELITCLPYPRSLFGLTISPKKRIGFLFTNLSIFNFRENNNINNSDEWTKWVKENGEARLVSEMMYGAAQAYCMDNKVKQKFTKAKLTAAIALSGAEVQKTIVDAWQRSQTFGLVESKKKQIAKAS